MPWRAGAEGLVLNHLTSGLCGAKRVVARVEAALLVTLQRVGDAGVVFAALTFPPATVRFPARARGRVLEHVGRALAGVRSRRVNALHPGRADIVLALVNVEASGWRVDVAGRAHTLAAHTVLSRTTVGGHVAAGVAELVDTDLTLEAVLVRVAELEAHAL